MSGAHLEVATTLADLPANVAATPPDLILLQNRLSGLSAEILSRHIRNELSTAGDISIVVLAESAGDVPDEMIVGTAISDEDLVAAIGQMIRHNAQRMTPQSPSGDAPVPMVPEEATPSGTTSTIAAHGDGALGEPPEEIDTISLGGQPANGTDTAGAGPSPVQPLTFREELETLTGPPRTDTPTEDAHSPFPHSAPAIVGRQSAVGWIVAAVLMIAVGTALFLSTRGTAPHPVPHGQSAVPGGNTANSADKSAAAGTASQQHSSSTQDMPALPEPASVVPPAAAKGPRTAFPRFIPPQSIVPGYGKNNPGWEQYLTKELEFRIFRKDHDIEALQVIDRTGNGLSRSFFTRTILEMAEVRDYRLQSKEIKGDYLIKRGILSPHADVILYKKRDDTQLRAFVVHYK